MPLLKRVNFNEILTFDRNTDKTGFVLQSDGFGNQVPTLKVFAPNEPAKVIVDPLTKERLGISIHGQRTNLIVRSGDHTVAPWSGGADISPDASFTVESDGGFGLKTIYDASNVNDNLRCERRYDFAPLPDTVCTYSFFIKKNTGGFARTGLFVAGSFSANFTVSSDTGDIVNQSTSQLISHGVVDAGGYWRVEAVLQTPPGMTSFRVAIGSVPETGSAFVNGDAGIIHVTGVQFEQGAFATPPIITSGTAVTRLADNCRILDIDQSDWFNPNEGTFVVEAGLSRPPTGAIARIVGASDGTSANRFVLTGLHSNSAIELVANSSGSVTQNIQFTGILQESQTQVKAALSFSENGLDLSVNGQAIKTISLPLAQGLDLIEIGNFFNAAHLNGTIKSITYEPRAYSAAELQQASQL